MTNREMIAHVRRRGHIALPIMTAFDVFHLIVEKTDLLAKLEDLGLDDECPWSISEPRGDGVRTLDVMDD